MRCVDLVSCIMDTGSEASHIHWCEQLVDGFVHSLPSIHCGRDWQKLKMMSRYSHAAGEAY